MGKGFLADARSAGEIPDVDGAVSSELGSWGTQPNLDESHGLCRKEVWSLGQGEPGRWVDQKPGARPGVRGRVLKRSWLTMSTSCEPRSRIDLRSCPEVLTWGRGRQEADK